MGHVQNELPQDSMTSIPRLYPVRAKRRDREARAWLVRLDAQPIGHRTEKAFAAWISKPGAEAALAHAAALWSEIDEAVLAERIEAAKLQRWRPSHTRTVWSRGRPVALAVSVAIFALVAPQIWLLHSADVRTGAFETRKVALDDGSAIELSSHSAIDIDYRKDVRLVRLLKGEAAFKVAPDRKRPFVVLAAGGETRALGTEFLVGWRDGGVTVTGIEHRIRITAQGFSRDLGPGEAAHYSRFAKPVSLAPDRHAGDWRHGVVIAENKSLADIATELDRYSDRPIWVVGQARSHIFSGVFRIADPMAGLRAAAGAAHLRLIELPGAVVVTAQ